MASGFAVQVMDALKEYNEQVNNAMKEVLPGVAKEAAKMVQGASPGSGRYASGWRAKVMPSTLGIEAVVYNGKTPGLPHLLEKGHAKRGGGRVGAIVHITPVEQWVKAEAVQKLGEVLR
jgi:hypothetical protein